MSKNKSKVLNNLDCELTKLDRLVKKLNNENKMRKLQVLKKEMILYILEKSSMAE